MRQEDDTQLIGRILSGDTRGYAGLVDRYKDFAYTLAFRILENREESEEVVQDAFVKAFAGLKSFRQHAKFSTWLYRIVYNASISKKRLKHIPLQSIEEYRYFDPAMEEDQFTGQERAGMIGMAMKQLSEEERTLVTLYYLDESSVDDIHAVTGLSRSNVKVKLFRARKKMQEYVKKAAVVMYG